MGGNFARNHDAVFVSINHRLNAFGYKDLAGVGGEKYKHSGNVGMLDIVVPSSGFILISPTSAEIPGTSPSWDSPAAARKLPSWQQCRQPKVWSLRL